jgi:hypothetical protein
MDLVVVRDADGALALLGELGAPRQLVLHHELVVEAAREILEGLGSFACCFDVSLVLIGAALHDAGKILHPGEIDGPGDRHELAGRDLLVDRGLADLARFCVTHAKWNEAEVTIEDLLVALADKLWKGKRVAELEQRVIERIAEASGLPFWDAFVAADNAFERVAGRGDERLTRSADTR